MAEICFYCVCVHVYIIILVSCVAPEIHTSCRLWHLCFLGFRVLQFMSSNHVYLIFQAQFSPIFYALEIYTISSNETIINTRFHSTLWYIQKLLLLLLQRNVEIKCEILLKATMWILHYFFFFFIIFLIFYKFKALFNFEAILLTFH